MITILLSQKIKQSCFLFLLLLLVPFTNGFAQDVYDGEYCPGPGQVGDEYANGIVFSQQLSASPSSTCEIGTIRAKVNTLTQVLRLGMNIGNGGAALFRLYLDTDNNPSTGLTSDTFGGSLSVAGAEYIIEINSNASTFNLYSGNGSTLTPLPINNGLAAKNGSAIGCNAGGGEFLEFNIPFGSIGINICDSNNPGLINITKLASVSGNSTSSSRCINTALTFGIPLKGSIDGSATVCSGTNSTNLEVKGLTTGSNITKWQSSVTPFLIWSDIAFTGTTYPATNLTQTTKFRAIFNNSGLCAGKDITTSEATITVIQSPVATAGQNQIKCNNSSFTMAALPTIGIGSWTFIGPSGTAVITNANSATTTVTSVPTDMDITLRWTETNGNCSSFDDVIIRNNAQSIAAAGQDQIKCNNNSFTMAATPTVGIGSWTFIGPSGTAVITSANSATTTVTSVPTDVDITLRWTETNGNCSSFDDVVIRNNAQSIAAAGQDQIKCNNNSFTMAATPTVGIGSWTFIGPSGTAVITNANSATTTVTSVPTDMDITLRWTETNGNCSSFDDVIIRNNAQSIAAAGQDQIKCNNNSFTMAATPTVGIGSWTFIGPSGSAVITNANSATSTVSSVPTDMDITLRWTETNGNCSSFDDVVIRNNEQSIAAAGQDQIKCNNNSFTMAATPTVGIGSWTFIGPSGTAVITNANSATSTVTSVPTDMDITLRWTETNGNCSSFDDVIIRNNAQSIAAAGQDQIKCNNNSFTMAATPTVGIGAWTFIGPSGTAIITNANSATSTVTSVPTDMDITLRWTETNGNCSSFDDVIIRNNAQSIAAAGQDQIKCNNNSFTMAATPTVGIGSWTFIGPSGSAVITNANSATSTVSSVPTDMDITLRWTETNGNCSSFDDVVIRNNEQSIAAAGQDQIKCNNNSFTMAATPTVGIGSWTFIGPSGTAVITNANSATTTVTSVPTDMDITLRWTETNGNCSSHDDVVIRNNAAPSPPIFEGNIIQCEEPSIQTLTAIANVPLGQSIVWYSAAENGIIVENPILNTVGSITYYAQSINNATSCISLTRTPVTLTIKTCQIAIVKSSDIPVGPNGCAVLEVGNVVNYTFTVTNSGNENLLDITVADSLTGLSPISFEGGDLNNNNELEITETWIYKASYTVTQADIDAGEISNIASVKGTAPDGTEVTDQSGDLKTNDKPNVIVICTTPKIAIVKANDINVGPNGCSILEVDNLVTYTFTVTNPGNVSLGAIQLSDPLAGLSAIVLESGDNNNNNILEVTEIWIYKATYKVTQADIDAGKITNQATVEGFAPDTTKVIDKSGASTTTDGNNVIVICTTPKIAIVKANDIIVGENGCTILEVDDVLTYTFTVTNPGNVSLSAVQLTDPLAGLSAIVLESGDNNSNNILEVSETWIYKATYKVTQADIDAGKITNQATVEGIAPDTTKVIDKSGDSTTTDGDNVIVICTTPDIAIVKTNDIIVGENGCTILEVDDVVTYTFMVTNPGNVSLSAVQLTDPLAGLSAIVLESGDANNNNILEVTETWIYKATYKVTQADIDAGKITNQATVEGTAPDNTIVTDQSGNTSNNDDSNIIPICTSANIAITKDGIYQDTDGDGITSIGDNVIYNFVVTNTGNVTLTNITVTDINAVVNGSPIASLEVNASDSTTITAIHTITQADINAGVVYNLATATGTPPIGEDVTATSTDPTPCTTCPVNEECPDCTITPLTQMPSLAITKDGIYQDTNGDGITNIGDNVIYNFVVTNTGNVTLTNIIVTDNNAVVSGSPITSLEAGVSDNTTIIAIHAITQEDINAGIVYNLAIATGTPPIGENVTATSTDPTPCTTCPVNEECPDCTITPLTQTPSLTITKDGIYQDTNGDGKVNIGDIVIYNFVVTNTGNVTLTNIIVTDNNAVVSGSPIASLAVGASDSTTITAIYTITQADINTGVVYNLATATGTPPTGDDVKATSTDPTPCTTCPVNEDCPDCTITPLTQMPSLAITKDGFYQDTNGDGKVNIGDNVIYNFVVTNTGNVLLTNITVTDNNAVVSGSPIASLAAGASDSTTITAIHAITQVDIDAGVVYNLATATGTPPIGDNITATSTDPTPCTTCPVNVECPTCTITPLTQNPSLTVIKTANSENYSSVGDIINYTIIVRNTGNVTLFSIAVKDPLTGLDTVIASLAPGISQEYTQNYTVTQSDRVNGTVTNVATANGFTPNQSPISASDDAVVEAAIVLGCETVIVHNAFSPNGDGINEWFVIENIEDFLCYPDNTVEIYNRWGVLVYETRGYNNTSNVFDGTSEGRTTIAKSSGLPTGVYFYILNYTSLGSNGALQTNRKDGYLYLTR